MSQNFSHVRKTCAAIGEIWHEDTAEENEQKPVEETLLLSRREFLPLLAAAIAGAQSIGRSEEQEVPAEKSIPPMGKEVFQKSADAILSAIWSDIFDIDALDSRQSEEFRNMPDAEKKLRTMIVQEGKGLRIIHGNPASLPSQKIQAAVLLTLFEDIAGDMLAARAWNVDIATVTGNAMPLVSTHLQELRTQKKMQEFPNGEGVPHSPILEKVKQLKAQDIPVEKVVYCSPTAPTVFLCLQAHAGLTGEETPEAQQSQKNLDTWMIEKMVPQNILHGPVYFEGTEKGEDLRAKNVSPARAFGTYTLVRKLEQLQVPLSGFENKGRNNLEMKEGSFAIYRMMQEHLQPSEKTGKSTYRPKLRPSDLVYLRSTLMNLYIAHNVICQMEESSAKEGGVVIGQGHECHQETIRTLIGQGNVTQEACRDEILSAFRLSNFFAWRGYNVIVIDTVPKAE